MVNQTIKLMYSSSLTNLCEVNSSFDTGVLKICYIGQNRNGSYISKEAMEKAIKTIYNCPIVCHYDRETDTIGGHDIELAKDPNGVMYVVNLTQPVGCIPESAHVWFEDFEEEDGTVHEYLCADVLLWKRQEAYRKIKSEGVSKHSMEITVIDGEQKDGVYIINDFIFTAFAIIGVEPCFEGSALKVFTTDQFKKELDEMKCELKKYYQSINSLNRVNYIENANLSEGGKNNLDEKNELLTTYGFKLEDLDFSIDDLSLEQLKEKLELKKKDFEMSGNIETSIRAALGVIKTPCEWSEDEETDRYIYIDYDNDKSEVYCYDIEDNWNIYGFTFSFNGDNVIIDFETKKRKKCALVDYDEGEQTSSIKEVFDQLIEVINNNADIKSKYQAATETIKSLEENVETLSKFKKEVEDASIRKEKDLIIEKFNDLVGIEAFDKLCEDADNYNVSDFEDACFIIRGKNVKVDQFSKTGNAIPKIKINNKNNKEVFSNEPYGGVVERLLK